MDKTGASFLFFITLTIVSFNLGLTAEAQNPGKSAILGKSLIEAAKRDDAAKLLAMVSKGTSLVRRDEDGSSLLHLAARAGSKKVVAFLLAQGFDPNSTSETGLTPLHEAKTMEVAKLLVDSGANVNLKDREFLMTPAFNAPLTVLDFLITKGADLESHNKEGMTVLGWAAYGNNPKRLKHLLSRGAKVNGGEGTAKTALHVASNWGHIETAELLLIYGANVNAKDDSGWTPLHWAALEGGVAMAQFLISHGANVNEQSSGTGKLPCATALDIAETVRFSEMVLLLEAYGGKRAKDLH